MGNNFFQEEDEFRDNPAEMVDGKWQDQPDPNAHLQIDAQVQLHGRPRPQKPQPVEQSVEPDYSEVDLDFSEDEDDDSAVLSDARLRLEQGKLYELIMKSDLFQDMDADPRAIHNVQREIKRYARERMEVMLGMRAPEVKQVSVASPFNSLEVDILKKIASKASGGATEKPEAEKATWDNPPVSAPKKQTLTPISQPKQAPKAAVQATLKKLTSKPQAQVARKSAPAAKAIVEEEYIPLEKDVSQMTTDEILERNKQVAARQAARGRAKSQSALPMPTYEQEEMLHTQRLASASINPTISALVAAISQKK